MRRTVKELTSSQGAAWGKVMLFGEYAVLEGGEAILTPTPHRATARFAPLQSSRAIPQFRSLWSEASGFTPFYAIDGGPLGSALIGDQEYVGVPFIFAQEALKRLDAPAGLYTIDTSQFGQCTEAPSVRWEKMGIGSSGASTLALVDLLCGGEPRDRFKLACEIHHAAQGALGSGADIAASAYGSLIKYRYQPQRLVTVLRSPLPLTAAIWSGGSQSTTASVRQVKQWSIRRPREYQSCLDELNRATEIALEALSLSDDSAPQSQHLWCSAFRVGAAATQELSIRSGTSIWTARHEYWSQLIQPLKGMIKPSGAGGDDLSLITASTAEDLSTCLTILQRDAYSQSLPFKCFTLSG